MANELTDQDMHRIFKPLRDAVTPDPEWSEALYEKLKARFEEQDR